MTRKHTPLADDRTISNLDALLDSSSSDPIPSYQQAMTELGRDLGRLLKGKIRSPESTYVAFTVEDADFLAKGLIETLTEDGVELAGVACFWNESNTWAGIKTTPIVKTYLEPATASIETLIIVKAIISSACVVKTNLSKLIEQINPSAIHIAAPVMFQGSEDLLKDEFVDSISSKFHFFTFAVDDERLDDGIIVPGVGGSVYEKLGFDDNNNKNSYMPTTVKQRRSSFSARSH